MNEYGEQYRTLPLGVWGVVYRVTIKTDCGWEKYEIDSIKVDDSERDIASALEVGPSVVEEIEVQTELYLHEFITEGDRRAG